MPDDPDSSEIIKRIFADADPMPPRELARTQAELDRHLVDAAKRLAADPAGQHAQVAWEQRVAPFLASHSDGWLAPAAVAARITKDGKEVPDREPVISALNAVAAENPLGKGEAVEMVFDSASLPGLTALRLAVDVAASQPDKSIKQLGGSIALTVQVIDAAGKARQLPLGDGEATAKQPIHRGGAEVPGIQRGWRLPATAGADDVVTAVWLIKMPIPLAAGDRIVVTVTSAGTLPVALAFSPLGSVQPFGVAAADDRAALATPRDARSPAQATRATTVFLLSTAHDAAAAARAHDLAARSRGLFGGRTWTMVTKAAEKPLPVRILPRGNWQDETGPVVQPANAGIVPPTDCCRSRDRSPQERQLR